MTSDQWVVTAMLVSTAILAYAVILTMMVIIDSHRINDLNKRVEKLERDKGNGN